MAATSPLQVLYQGHPVGNTNVVEVVLYFWNGGKLPIRTEDVLESRVLHISRSVTKFEIHPVSESAKNVLPMSFGILENDDGAAIQLIYAGKSDTAITVSGTIVGAGIPRFFSEGPLLHSPEEAYRMWERFHRAFPPIVYSLTAAVFILMAVRLLRSRPSDQQYSETRIKLKRKYVLIVFGMIGLIYLGMAAQIYHDTHRPEVPYSVIGH
jgi:hypothetical protein